MTEIWKDIPGYEGEYQASNKGRIRSLDRYVKHRNGTKFCPGVLLHQHFREDGYYELSLRYDKWLVHRLVLMAFVSLNPEGMECRHLNGIKTDNRLENLKWGTRLENFQDRLKHGVTVRGENCGMSKLTKKKVLEIREKANQGIGRTVLSKQYGVSQQHISRIVLRQRWGWLD